MARDIEIYVVYEMRVEHDKLSQGGKANLASFRWQNTSPITWDP